MSYFLIFNILCSDRRNGTLALICEIMDMNIYELIKGKIHGMAGNAKFTTLI